MTMTTMMIVIHYSCFYSCQNRCWKGRDELPIRCHSPFGMKLVVSPLSLPFSCRSIPLMSYVHDPNFISHSWSSNGNHVMSILHVLKKSPGGTQRQSPFDDTTTFVGNVLSMSSSALFRHCTVASYLQKGT